MFRNCFTKSKTSLILKISSDILHLLCKGELRVWRKQELAFPAHFPLQKSCTFASANFTICNFYFSYLCYNFSVWHWPLPILFRRFRIPHGRPPVVKLDCAYLFFSLFWKAGSYSRLFLPCNPITKSKISLKHSECHRQSTSVIHTMYKERSWCYIIFQNLESHQIYYQSTRTCQFLKGFFLVSCIVIHIAFPAVSKLLTLSQSNDCCVNQGELDYEQTEHAQMYLSNWLMESKPLSPNLVGLKRTNSNAVLNSPFIFQILLPF